jgi:hypothetical protein
MHTFLTFSVLVGSVATIITVFWGLRTSMRSAAFTAREQRRGVWTGTALLVAWFAAAILSSWFGLYQGAATRIPTIEFGLLVPIITGVVLYRTSPFLRRMTAAAPQSLLVGIQFFRVEGVIFLVLLLSGSLPGVFALPAGTGDVAVGLLAPAVAWAFTRRGSTGLVRAWNLLGLADLAVAVTTGFLTSPSPMQVFALDRPNTLITAFPLVMIPVFLVPLAVLLHLASLATAHRARYDGEVFQSVPAPVGRLGVPSGRTPQGLPHDRILTANGRISHVL